MSTSFAPTRASIAAPSRHARRPSSPLTAARAPRRHASRPSSRIITRDAAAGTSSSSDPLAAADPAPPGLAADPDPLAPLGPAAAAAVRALLGKQCAGLADGVLSLESAHVQTYSAQLLEGEAGEEEPKRGGKR